MSDKEAMRISALLFIFTLSFICLAEMPPIEGGKEIPFTDTKYIDFIKITSPESSSQTSCSATVIAYNKILTAAHCIVELGKEDLPLRYKKGGYLGFYGRIKSIHIPDEYFDYVRAYKKEPLDSPNRAVLHKKKTLFDIAIIITDKLKSKRKMPYP